MTAMKTLLLLTALLTLLANANVRRDCTAEEMEGLQIVGYAYERVFRFTNYTGLIDLRIELSKTVNERSDVKRRDVGQLVHLHQGFDRRLIVLRYGYHFRTEDKNGEWKLREKIIYTSNILLAVLDEASVDSRKVVEMTWAGFNGYIPEDNKNFASFVYGDRLYYEGGFSNTTKKEMKEYFTFYPNARDICADMKFPVVDIAVDPPTCHNRMLNETADSEAADDEWIVALVDGIRTTRSKTLCEQPQNIAHNDVPTEDGNIRLPHDELYCYYLMKPGMKTPCLFADGTKNIFIDVQVEPANPVRMAKKVSSTTNSPITTESAPEAASSQSSSRDEPEPSGTTTYSCVLCRFSVLCLFWIGFCDL